MSCSIKTKLYSIFFRICLNACFCPKCNETEHLIKITVITVVSGAFIFIIKVEGFA